MLNNIFKLQKSILCATLLFCSLPVASNDKPPGFDCVIMPSQTVELGSTVPGQLDTVLVDRSDTVTAGQIVATLDSRVEKTNLAIAHFKAASNTELSLRKATFEIDHRAEKRLSSLALSNMVSAHDKDRAVREARPSNWRMKIAEDDLHLQTLELARAETALDRRRIRSPIDGVVVARLRNPGEYIEDKLLLRIVKLDPLHVEAILPMRLFGNIRPGMLASVTPEHNEIANLKAIVELIDPMGDAASGAFGVRLKLPNPDRIIPAGLKCRVEISSASPVLSSNGAATNDSPRFAAADRDQKSLN